MAGRPRTTLKQLDDWKQQAAELSAEIDDRIPASYFDYPYVNGVFDHEDEYGAIDFDKIPGFDRVAFFWSQAREYAGNLDDALLELQRAVRQRLEGKVARLDRRAATTEPVANRHEGNTPHDSEPMDTGEEAESGTADEQTPAS
jgi:hypothetical protein